MIEIRLLQSETAELLHPTVIATLVNLPVALAIAFVAWRQWLTARDKLALDLFDRRLENFRRWNEIQSKRIAEINSGHPLDFLDGEKFKFDDSDYGNIIQQAHFLFGAEISDHIKQVDDDIAELAKLKLISSPGKEDRYHHAMVALNKAREGLQRAVEPHMVMSHISGR